MCDVKCLIAFLLTLCMASCQTPLSPPHTVEPANAVKPSGRELLDAIVHRHSVLALELIKKGTDPNAADDRSSALYYASGGFCGLEVVRALVERGAEVNRRCIGGETPLFNACECGCPEILEYLIQQGAKVSIRDDHGETPLHVAAFTIDSHYGDATTVVSILLDHGADVAAKDVDGVTPIDLARRTGYSDRVAQMEARVGH